MPTLQVALLYANAGTMIARSIFFEGHVQGVFFREWTIERAREFEVAGWVRNLSDGRVEVYVVGHQAEVVRFIERVRTGAPASQVANVHVEDATVEQLDGFTRRQSA